MNHSIYSTSSVRTPNRNNPALTSTLDLIRGSVDPHTQTAVVSVRALAERRGINRDKLRLQINALSEEGQIEILKNGRDRFVCVLRG
jgi:hypothetical protein